METAKMTPPAEEKKLQSESQTTTLESAASPQTPNNSGSSLFSYLNPFSYNYFSSSPQSSTSPAGQQFPPSPTALQASQGATEQKHAQESASQQTATHTASGTMSINSLAPATITIANGGSITIDPTVSTQALPTPEPAASSSFFAHLMPAYFDFSSADPISTASSSEEAPHPGAQLAEEQNRQAALQVLADQHAAQLETKETAEQSETETETADTAEEPDETVEERIARERQAGQALGQAQPAMLLQQQAEAARRQAEAAAQQQAASLAARQQHAITVARAYGAH